MFDYLIIRGNGLTVPKEETEETSREWEKIHNLKKGNKYKINKKKPIKLNFPQMVGIRHSWDVLQVGGYNYLKKGVLCWEVVGKNLIPKICLFVAIVGLNIILRKKISRKSSLDSPTMSAHDFHNKCPLM